VPETSEVIANATAEPGTSAEAHPGAEPIEEAAASVKDRLEELELELERLRMEAEAASDRALRTLAEFDNYRRRNEKERESARREGALPVLRELLDVADNFDRALEHAGEDVPKAFLEGMRLVASGLHDLLDRRGVSKIEVLGATFDPEIHEALTSSPSEDVAPNTIIREVQPGYRWGDRVLRPAKVIVAAAIRAGQNE
jgi:molecular chaperone GrpE